MGNLLFLTSREPHAFMFIGEIAAKTGLTVKAIRFYETKGLIEPVRSGRYRTYQQQDIELLVMIREAKAMGATLAELQGVIQYRDGVVDWARIRPFLLDLRQRLEQQRQQIDGQLETLGVCLEQLAKSNSTA